MKLHIKFMLSATDAAHFPAPSVPEVAFLGRSNAGKSSLLNALAGTPIARVSSTPGRTRAINFFSLHAGTEAKPAVRPTLLFADLPGYGYAKISKSISAEWPSFIEPYLADRPTLALCICLVDSNIPPQPADLRLIEYFRATGRNFLVVATKSDKLKSNGLNRSLTALRRAFALDEVLPVSAKTKAGLNKLWPRLLAAASST
jgi:GTP-binding protein